MKGLKNVDVNLKKKYAATCAQFEKFMLHSSHVKGRILDVIVNVMRKNRSYKY
jgi:hypothetical protein